QWVWNPQLWFANMVPNHGWNILGYETLWLCSKHSEENGKAAAKKQTAETQRRRECEQRTQRPVIELRTWVLASFDVQRFRWRCSESRSVHTCLLNSTRHSRLKDSSLITRH